MSDDDDALGWLEDSSDDAKPDGEEEFQDALDWLQESGGGGGGGGDGDDEGGLDWLGGEDESAPALVDDEEEEDDDSQQSIFSMALDDFFEGMEETEGGGAGTAVAPEEGDQTVVTGRRKRKRRTGDEQRIDKVMNTLVRYLTRKEAVRESQLDTVFRLTLGKIVEPISAEVILVYKLEADGQSSMAHLFYSRTLFRNHPDLEEKFNQSLGTLGKTKIAAGQGIVGRALSAKKPITSLDASNDRDFLDHLGKATGYQVRTMLTVPIMDGEEHVFGAIQVMNKDPDSGEEFFSYQDLKLVETMAAYLGRLMHLVADPEIERTDDEIAGYYARMAKTEVVDPTNKEQFEWDPKLWGLVTTDVIRKYKILPVRMLSGKGVQVVMVNPTDLTKRSGFESATDLRIEEAWVATEGKIDEVIEQVSGQQAKSAVTNQDMAALIGQLEVEEGAEDDNKKSGGDDGEGEGENDTGLMKLVNQIIEQAYLRGVSDIHIEPHPEKDVLVRYRIDGVCQKFTTIPRRFARAIISRLKIMSDLDIAEKRKPQDGKIKFKKFGKVDIELRVATLPTQGGVEDCVMRILAASKPIPLDKMGFAPEKYESFVKVIQQPYGLCLVVGPTGSGKTTTLHSAMGFINTPERKIWTAEDPVEITQDGLRQVQVHPKIGFTFERALRAFLRADPDVIMIGEMRDKETAEAGIEASLTGHMVFSTLHTNSAPETVTRLLDMEIDPYSFGDSLLGVLAQRLMRRLCDKCRKPVEPTPELLAEYRTEFGFDEAWQRFDLDNNAVLFEKGAGCAKCGKSGYKGRMGIHEFMTCSDDIRSIIYRSGKVAEITAQAKAEGMTTLKQDGIRKVLQGLSDIFEVRRVCIK